MASKVAGELADAIRTGAQRHAERAGPGRYRATVTAWTSEDAFDLDVHGSDVPLDQDDVTLGQSVRRYEQDQGVEVGDALILLELGEGDFVAVEVESDNPPGGS